MEEELKSEKTGVTVGKWIREKTLLSPQPCEWAYRETYQSLHYYEINCRNLQKSISGFYSREKRGEERDTGFRLLGKERVGKKIYFRVQFTKSSAEASGKIRELGRQKNYGGKRNTNQELPTRSDREENPNLQYFVSLAKEPEQNRDINPDLRIFFDESCPLIYNQISFDFYWDNQIYHEFTISCTQTTAISVIRIPANKFGEIRIGKESLQTIQPGKKFLGTGLLKVWKGDHLTWDEVKVYPYE